MKLILVSVFDSKVGSYTNPQCMRSVGEAIRSFSDAVKSEGSVFSRHSADYVLYQVGTFDDSTSVLVHEPKALITGPECLTIVE